MPRYIAFLRAVNVGGSSAIKMEALRRVFEDLGFSNVTSFIASGNIIFEAAEHNSELLERQIEEGLLRSLGKDLTPFVRTAQQLARIAAFDAFPNIHPAVGDQLAVIFLSSSPSAKAVKALEGLHSQTDEFRAQGREIYWLRHTGADGLVYSTVPLDRVLAEPFTTRSMSTLKKLAEKYVPKARSRRAS